MDSIFNKNQDRLWLRCRKYSYGDDDYAYYLCYDKDHKISSRDTLYFAKTISIKKLKFVSALMPSLKILQLDPLEPVQYAVKDKVYVKKLDNDLDYRDYEDKAVPITKIFPQVTCLILPGETETDNFVGHLSQVKHLTLFDGIQEGLPTFPNLESLEARTWSYKSGINCITHVPTPSKRFVQPLATIKWRKLPKTLEIIETRVIFDEYISIGKPHFKNLKILRGSGVGRYKENESVETLMNFLRDHKGSLTELSFSAEKDDVNIKVLLPLLTNLHKLSVEIKTDKQAIELKEIKALAYSLQYFQLLFYLSSGTDERLDPILENLSTGVDNFSIKGVNSYEEIDTFMDKIMAKVVNGDTKTVTIAGIKI